MTIDLRHLHLGRETQRIGQIRHPRPPNVVRGDNIDRARGL